MDVAGETVVDVVVVGAGSAGCVVAEILSRDASRRVMVLEAGPDRDPTNPAEPTAGPDLFAALAAPGRLWPDVLLEPGAGTPARPYLRGRGVGGSGAVNGMVLQTGAPQDYDRWAARPGCNGWGWSDVGPILQRRLAAAHESTRTGLGPAERLIVAAASTWPDRSLVIETTRLALDGNGRRRSSDVSDLFDARKRPNLELCSNAAVRRVLFDGRAHGVELDDGRIIEAATVVLCGGALESPAILRRSGVERPGVGENLHDHPAVTLALLPIDGDPAQRPTCSVIATLHPPGPHDAPIQVLPLNRTAPSPSSAPALLAGVLRQHGRGTLHLDASASGSTRPVLRAGFLDDEHDRAALRSAGRLLAELAATVAAVPADRATPAPGDDDDAWDRWVTEQIGPYFHAAGTCRMGDVRDDAAVVDRDAALIGHAGVYVIDASVFPDQPAASPYLPTLAVAELAATRLATRLADVAR